MNKLRFVTFAITAFAVLVLSAVRTMPVLADDNTPPSPETAGSTSSEGDDPAQETAPIAETLTQIPEGTDVMVVNANGKAVPLATQEALVILNTNDPIWCPAGVAPNPGVGGCTTTQSSFNGGLLPLITNKKVNGIIWIMGDYQGTFALEGGPITFIVDTTQNYNLTIKGGWTGTSAGVIDSSNPSEFNVPLNILSWNKPLVLSDIEITAASGGFGYALYLNTADKVTLTNVDIHDNNTTNAGVLVRNYGGRPSATVVINDSAFNNNTGTHGGLWIQSGAAITIRNIQANGNTGHGAHLATVFADFRSSVTLTGFNQFNLNGGNGLYVISEGAINASNITATFNTGGSGAYLDNCFYDPANYICNNPGASAVNLTGFNNFNNNGWDGLRVYSNGIITVNNLTANGNGTSSSRPSATLMDPGPDQYYLGDGYGKGVFLNNYGAITPKAMNINGTNAFNNNASDGLYAFSWGALKVSNLTSNNNGCNLAYDRDVYYCAGAYLDASGVTLTGYGKFINNAEKGLKVYSINAPATLNNLTAEFNGDDGVYVYMYSLKTSPLSILGANVFNGNEGEGLFVYSDGGTVTLRNITANLNDGSGVVVNNSFKWSVGISAYVPASASVTLSGINIFNGNGGNGLIVNTTGAITASNLTASYNGSGVYLENCNPTGSSCALLISKPVTLIGNNTFNNNSSAGLFIESWGSIQVSNLMANGNGTIGASLNNNWATSGGKVTITGFSQTSNNGKMGLEIRAHGTVLAANLTANSNGPTVSPSSSTTDYVGAFISNGGSKTGITLLGINQFNDNWNTGLTIYSTGAVVISNITASNNGTPYDAVTNPVAAGSGLVIDNTFPLYMAMPVTLTGTNTFNGNLDDGLNISSKGAIVLNNVTANENGETGVYLKNQYNWSNFAVTLLGFGIFNDNQDHGLQIYSNGAVTTNNLTANSNAGGAGVYINNKYNALSTSFVNVTMKGFNQFNDNLNGNGLSVYSDGIITLNNVVASENGGYGAHLDNVLNGGSLKNIILAGSSVFTGNTLNGFDFASSGALTVAQITADANDDGVVDIYYGSGVAGTAVGNITLSCGSLNFNEGAGYNLTSTNGIITLQGVFTFANDQPNSAIGGAPLVTRACPLP